ncbi:transcriptional regulator [Pseudomonas viridiflava]|uniref:transcriptional regulator n=1 Tax=Pseudomonas viridiflava TaxID=33069 RepID=UPI00198035BE|nr:transcriptional regulator [Pseudomonas viridiflava]
MSLKKQEAESEDHTFGSLNRLTRTLHHHNERGLILSLAAFAEEALGRLIEAFLLPVASSKDLLSGFNAPLGTFSSRIKTCLALGLITNQQFVDLECLRKIRNEFAHAWEHVSLDDKKLASLVVNMSFSYLDETYPETNADKVRSSILGLLTDVSSMAEQIKSKDRGVKVIGTNLVPMFPIDLPDPLGYARGILDDIRLQYLGSTGARKKFCEKRLELFGMQMAYLFNKVPSEAKGDVLKILKQAEDLQA